MLYVVDDNSQMKKDIVKLNQDIDKLTLENKKLSQKFVKIAEEKKRYSMIYQQIIKNWWN